jgi:hypothetical protein
MSYKPDEKDWMAYLYGEQEEADQLKFEEYIRDHPEAGHEFDKLRTLRTVLSQAEDKEVIAPPLFVTNPSSESHGAGSYPRIPRFIKVFSAVAASLLLLMVAGKLTQTELIISGSEWKLTFGAPSKAPSESNNVPLTAISPEQVQEMIDASLHRNNALVQASLEETEKKLQASIRSNLALSSDKMSDLAKAASSASQQEIRQFVDGMRAENRQLIKEYFQLSSTEQKKYIENLLVDFTQYLQQQRNNDLQLVQTRMSSLEQNTDLFKQETEQILSASLLRWQAPAELESTTNNITEENIKE